MTIPVLLVVLIIIAYVFHRRRHRHRHLKPATDLQSSFVKSQGEKMEVYNLTWTPSVTSTASTQDVKSLIGGVATDIALGLANTVAAQQFTFDTDAAVEWWVVTYNADKSKSVESAHATFTATDQSALAPATGLAEAWVSHS